MCFGDFEILGIFQQDEPQHQDFWPETKKVSAFARESKIQSNTKTTLNNEQKYS
jgi:hypothetical protein